MNPPPATRAPRRDRRPAAANSLQAWTQLLLTAAIFLLVNVLSCQRFAQRDTTRSRQFTLSPVTGQVIDALDKRARIIVAFADAGPLRDKVWRLARAYADRRPGHLRAQLLDPLRDPDAARDLAARFNHEFKDNAVLVISGSRIEVIPEEHLEIRRQRGDGTMASIGFIAEDAITAALLRLREPEAPAVYLITGKGPWPGTTQGNGADTLRRLLPRYHAALKELSLEGAEAIPADAAAVLIANPRYDFSGAEIRLLREFWEKRKGGLVVMLNPAAATPNLDAFLRYHGIVPDRRTVLRVAAGPVGPIKELAVPARFLAGPVLTDAFLNTDTRFPGTSIALEVLEDRDEVRARGLRPVALVQADPAFWAESAPAEPDVAFDPGDDRAGPLVLAAAVERAAVEEAGLRVPAARLVVFANPHLLDPDALLQANVDFFFSSLNWVMDRSHLVGIGPRQPVLYQVKLTERQSRLLHSILLAGLPALALAAAWVVHLRRRS
jgi:hypothetical protein